MAKKSVNKSELIREYFKSNPTAGPSDVARAVTEQGYPVSPAHVNQALRGIRKKRKKGRGRPIGSKNKSSVSLASSGKRAIDQLTLAADFCKACGGVDTAIGVLSSLKHIASKL
jgi:hypothetical protein